MFPKRNVTHRRLLSSTFFHETSGRWVRGPRGVPRRCCASGLRPSACRKPWPGVLWWQWGVILCGSPKGESTKMVAACLSSKDLASLDLLVVTACRLLPTPSCKGALPCETAEIAFSPTHSNRWTGASSCQYIAHVDIICCGLLMYGLKIKVSGASEDS